MLILKRKAELLRDIARVKKDVDENGREIAFFEDPVAFENERKATKEKEMKKAMQKFNRSPKKGLQQFIDSKQVHDDTKVFYTFSFDVQCLFNLIFILAPESSILHPIIVGSQLSNEKAVILIGQITLLFSA